MNLKTFFTKIKSKFQSSAQTPPKKELKGVVSSRLMSLDIMRGSVMLFLTVIQPILLAWIAYRTACNDPLPESFCIELTHVDWEGLNLWDLVMPTFIFMCGAAIPFAVPKYLNKNGSPKFEFFTHLAMRVVMLWLLGMMIQGNLLTFEWDMFFFFTNTLQAIAAGYLITAIVYLIPIRTIRFALPFIFMFIYALLLEDHGGYTKTYNYAYEVEQYFLPGLQDDPKYTWILTSLMYSAMAMIGSMCGEILKLPMKWFYRSLWLALLCGVLLTGGSILANYIPVIKAICTISFTMLAMGWAVLFLAILYTIIDGFKFYYGFGIVTMFGQCALVAYVLHEFLYHTVLLKLGEKLSVGIWYHYNNHEDVTLHELAPHAYTFMVHVVASLFILVFVYYWYTRKRAIKQCQLLQEESTYDK